MLRNTAPAPRFWLKALTRKRARFGISNEKSVSSVFDFDLWRGAQPGLDEQFDADRFGEWLELLVETDATIAARIVAAVDEHLVIAGLSRYVRVFDPSAIALPASLDDEPVDSEVAPPGDFECEVGGYLVRAIRPDAWDAIVALLLALDADHHGCFHAVMRGCRRLSNSAPEVDGLDDLLPDEKQLFHDVALDRENRRSQQGYSTRADARAFLQMARQRGAAGSRMARRGRIRSPRGTFGPPTNPPRQRTLPLPGSPGALWHQTRRANPSPRRLTPSLSLLAEAGLVPQRPRALLEGARAEQSRLTSIRPLMEYVRDKDDTTYLTRNQELAFLANTLMAGCSIQSRSFTPQEASDAVVGVCNLGLEHWPDGGPGPIRAARSPRDVQI